MRFGDVIRAKVGTSIVNVAKALEKRGLQFVELVSTQPFYTPPRGDAASLAKLYNTNPWVRSIVGKVGKTVAKQKWYLEKPNGERVDEHEALAWLRNGCRKIRGRQAIAATVTIFDLQGEAFWIVGRKGSKPAEYAPVPAHWVVDIPHDGFKFYSLQPKSGVRFDIPEDQVIWFKDVDPFDPYGRGSSLTGALKVEISTDESASTFLDKYFKNFARPDVIISGSDETPLSDKEAPRLEAAWNEKHRGPGKAGRAFFSRHPLTVTEVGTNLRDNEMSNLRANLQSTIFGAYGVSPELFGQLESSNRATIESAEYLFALHTIDPRLSALCEHLDTFIAANFEIGDLRLCYENPVRENSELALNVMKAFPTNFTGNEVRELIGRKKRDDLEELNAPPVDPFAEDGEGDDPDGEPGGGKKPKKPADDPDEELDDDEDEDKQHDLPERSKDLSAEELVRVASAHEDPMVRVEASAIMDRIFRKLLQTYGAELLEKLEAANRFELNMRVAEWLTARGSKLIAGIDATTREAIKAALVTGVAENEALEALSARIERLFADAANTRAATIGVTEATHLTGFASQAAAEQGGFERKQWLSSRDQVVRDTHRSLDGQIVNVTENFKSKRGGSAPYPGAFREAAEDINCRCAIRPVLSGEKAAITDSKSFLDWHEDAYAKIATEIEDTIADIFQAQAKVVITQLQRSWAKR